MMFKFGRTFLISLNLFFAIPIRLRTSPSHLPSFVIIAPRYLQFFTWFIHIRSKLMLRIKSWELFVRPITSVFPRVRFMWRPLAAQAKWRVSTSSWRFSLSQLLIPCHPSFFCFLRSLRQRSLPQKTKKDWYKILIRSDWKNYWSFENCHTRSPVYVWPNIIWRPKKTVAGHHLPLVYSCSG